MSTSENVNSLHSESETVTELLRHIDANNEFPQLAHYSLTILYKKIVSNGSNNDASCLRDDYISQIVDLNGTETLLNVLLRLGRLDYNYNDTDVDSDAGIPNNGTCLVPAVPAEESYSHDCSDSVKKSDVLQLELQLEVIKVLKILISVHSRIGSINQGSKSEACKLKDTDDSLFIEDVSDYLNGLLDIVLSYISDRRDGNLPKTICFAYLDLIHCVLLKNERCRIGLWDKLLDLALHVFSPTYLLQRNDKVVYETLHILTTIIGAYQSKSFLFDSDRSRTSLVVIWKCLCNVTDWLVTSYDVSD